MNQEQQTNLEERLAKEYQNIAGIYVLKNGVPVYESYFNNCSATSRIHVYSISKSILALLIGIALDQGAIKSVNQKALDFFPHYQTTSKEQVIQQVRLHDLLNMTAPYKYRQTPLIYIRYFMSKDWVRFSLNQLGGKEQIGRFNYTPLIGPDILSGVLLEATGQTAFDFATKYLFTPLEITVKESLLLPSTKAQKEFNQATTISGWVADSNGVNAGGWGLTLSVADMAKIGQLYLNEGVWNGQRIVSSHWLKESTTEQSRWTEMELPFGYLLWIINQEEGAYAAMGDGGNVIYFNQQKQLVVAINSLFMKKPKDRIKLIQEYIVPLFD